MYGKEVALNLIKNLYWVTLQNISA